MNTKQTPHLTRGDVKMVGVPQELHAEIKILAARDRKAMYAVVAEAIRLYKALHQNGIEVQS